MTKFPRRARVDKTSVVWQRNAMGQWERHLVRTLTNGRAYWSRLVHVDTSKPVCLHCLSTNVEVREDPDVASDTLFCRDCGVTYGFV